MSERSIVPILGAGQLVLFPGMRCSVHLRSKQAHAALLAAERGFGTIAVFASRFEVDSDHGVGHFHHLGTLARVLSFGPSHCGGGPAAHLEGFVRVRIEEWRSSHPYREASCSLLAPANADGDAHRLAFDVAALANRIHLLFPRCRHAVEAAERVSAAATPEAVLGAVGGLLFNLPTLERQRLLELDSLRASLEATLFVLHERLALATPPTAVH